jgi:hypothetical protein
MPPKPKWTSGLGDIQYVVPSNSRIYHVCKLELQGTDDVVVSICGNWIQTPIAIFYGDADTWTVYEEDVTCNPRLTICNACSKVLKRGSVGPIQSRPESDKLGGVQPGQPASV